MDEQEDFPESDEGEDAPEGSEQEQPPDSKESPPSEDSPGRSLRREDGALRDFPEEERRLILAVVNRFWRDWGGGFTAATREDMLGEAVLALQEVRARVAPLPGAAAARFVVVAIWRRLRKRAGDEFRQRLRRNAQEWIALDPEQLQRLEEESGSDWRALAGDAMRERIDDPQISAALSSLSRLDQRILDLRFTEGLRYTEIADRLNAAPADLPRGRKMTARAVENRCKRAIQRLREFLGAEQGD